MAEETEFLLLTGPPRTGTTMLMDWLQQSVPGEKLWLRESGVPNLAHHLVSALEFERRNHAWGFDLVQDKDRRLVVMNEIRRLVLSLCRTYGWREGMRIIDKEPYVAPDGLSFFVHLREVFPRIRALCMLRGFPAVISSMLRRSWGRGPFPRPNRISPFSYQFSDLENCLGDLLPGGAETLTVDRPVGWSLQKCCASYRNAINNIYDLVANGQPVMVLNYEDLVDLARVLPALQRFTGIEFTGPYQFVAPSPVKHFDPDEELILQQELWETGTIEKYEELREHAERELAT